MPLKEVFRHLGALLHAHQHLAKVAQGVPPERFGARGRVQARRGHDGGAVPRVGQQVLEALDHLQYPLVPRRARLVGRGEHCGEARNTHEGRVLGGGGGNQLLLYDLDHLPPLERPGKEDVAQGAGRIQPARDGKIRDAVRVKGVLAIHVHHAPGIQPAIRLGQLGEDRELLEEQGQAPRGGIQEGHHARLDPPAEELVERAISCLQEGQGLPTREFIRAIARPSRWFHDLANLYAVL